MSSRTKLAKSENWLITGGAGYIGSHIAERFLRANKGIVVIDSLRTSSIERIEYLKQIYGENVSFLRGDILDHKALDELFKKNSFSGVVHAAGLKSVEESFIKPSEYFYVNTEGTSRVLEKMIQFNVKKIIYSSSAAVYGIMNRNLEVGENATLNPVSPYGESKKEAEDLINMHINLNQISGISLRFFNVIGSFNAILADKSTNNLVPIILNCIKNSQTFRIFGNDYPTTDGTCIRDYVDVRDVAEVHLKCSELTNLPLSMNVGTGQGQSVLQVVRMALNVLNESKLDISISARREGDPAILFADTQLLSSTFGFTTNYTLEDSIRSLQ